MRVALLHTLIRPEEKLLVQALADRGVDHDLVDVRQQAFPLERPPEADAWDVALLRVLSHHQALAAARALEAWDVPVVNPSAVVETCGDKWATSLALSRAGVPTPRTRVALDPETARAAAEELGFPVVVKPTLGSWGRLLARCNDADALEAVLEHKDVLGGPHHQVLYLQELVDKPGRDVRLFVVGGQAVCAIYRTSDHWIANTARGARATDCPVTGELADLAARVTDAVGGEVLAIDLMEDGEADGDLLVHEVNHTTEFRNSIEPTGVDLPGRIVDRLVGVGKR